MRKLIKIRLANPRVLRIFFVVTTACPYACRYCPDELHLGKNKTIDLDELETFFRKFSDRPLVVNLTGGECTQHSQFEDIIKLLRKLNIKVGVDTNSVRTVRFYKEFGMLADVWNVTLHPSQHTLDLEKIQVLTKHSYVVVYVMMDNEHWDTSVSWLKQVSQIPDLKVIPLKTINNYGGCDYQGEYTPEQNEFLLNTPNVVTLTPSRLAELKGTHSYLLDTDGIGTYDNGDEEILDYNMIIKRGENNFYGWQCVAGNESLNINADESVVWANCGIKSYAHFRDVDPEELKIPVTCNRVQCYCGADVRSTKERK